MGERGTGLLLLLLAAGVFLASANDWIPPICFFAGLPLSALGALKFMKGNRVADEALERRILRNTNPELKNRTGMHSAGIQARHAIEMDDEHRHVAQSAVVQNELIGDELVLYELEDEISDEGEEALVISNDVSFPVAVQQHSSVADQLDKLRKLAKDGAINQEEFEAAKARILA